MCIRKWSILVWDDRVRIWRIGLLIHNNRSKKDSLPPSPCPLPSILGRSTVLIKVSSYSLLVMLKRGIHGIWPNDFYFLGVCNISVHHINIWQFCQTYSFSRICAQNNNEGSFSSFAAPSRVCHQRCLPKSVQEIPHKLQNTGVYGWFLEQSSTRLARSGLWLSI